MENYAPVPTRNSLESTYDIWDWLEVLKDDQLG